MYFKWIILLLIIFGTSLLLLNSEPKQKVIKKNARRFTKFSENMKKDLEENYLSELMKAAGVPINLFHYQVFRFTILGIWGVSLLFKGGVQTPIQSFIFLSLTYFLTIPKEKIFGKTSLFFTIVNISQKNKRAMYNKELYMVIAQMKNMFIIKSKSPPSSIVFIESVRDYANKTQPIFNKMLSFWYLGEKQKAADYFEKEIGTEEAKKLTQVFLKLDHLNPSEMKNQLSTYQSIYRSQQETAKLKMNEHKSNFLFLLVVITCLFLLLNFAVVIFVIDWINDFNAMSNI